MSGRLYPPACDVSGVHREPQGPMGPSVCRGTVSPDSQDHF